MDRDEKMQKVLACARDAALAAGNSALRNFGGVEAREKSKNNLVTAADIECENLIASMIGRLFPSHAILAEEQSPGTAAGADNLWIVDPLDGTNNFAHGIPHFCVSIGYAERGEPLAAVVFDPIRNELFSATKDGGAFLNGKRISVSATTGVSQSIIATGSGYNRGEILDKTLDTLRLLLKADLRGVRRLGSAALDLCWVACGRFDAYFEYLLSPWDFAAGMLVVKESGGICADRAGAKLSLTSGGLIVSNGHIHNELMKFLKWEAAN